MSPLEAKKNIESLPHDSIKKIIFTKGLINILPPKVTHTLKNNLTNQSIKNVMINDAGSHSGSTRSDEDSKNRKKELFSGLDFSEDGSINRSSIRKSFEENKKSGRSSKASSFIKSHKLNNLNLNSEPFCNDVSTNPQYFNEESKIVLDVEEENCNLVPVSIANKYENKDQFTSIIRESSDSSNKSNHVVIIPISGSHNFNNSNNRQAYNEFMNLFNIKTTVLGSSKKDLVGTTQTILSKAQFCNMETLMDDEFDSNNPQIKALMNPNFIGEDDVFWDNFWLFKKKEEERKIKEVDLDSDDEPTKKHKIGDLMKNPQILIQMMLKKKFKKFSKNIIFINSIGGLTLMTLLFILQLKYSKRFRYYTKVLLQLSLFGITILGFGGSIFYSIKE